MSEQSVCRRAGVAALARIEFDHHWTRRPGTGGLATQRAKTSQQHSKTARSRCHAWTIGLLPRPLQSLPIEFDSRQRWRTKTAQFARREVPEGQAGLEARPACR